MNFTSKKSSLFTLGITSIVFSRIMFVFFNDPEGPNLLIVLVAAAVVYFLSFIAFSSMSSASGLKRLLLTILTQAIIVACFYFFLR